MARRGKRGRKGKGMMKHGVVNTMMASPFGGRAKGRKRGGRRSR